MVSIPVHANAVALGFLPAEGSFLFDGEAFDETTVEHQQFQCDYNQSINPPLVLGEREKIKQPMVVVALAHEDVEVFFYAGQQDFVLGILEDSPFILAILMRHGADSRQVEYRNDAVQFLVGSIHFDEGIHEELMVGNDSGPLVKGMCNKQGAPCKRGRMRQAAPHHE